MWRSLTLLGFMTGILSALAGVILLLIANMPIVALVLLIAELFVLGAVAMY
jgi:hypothetical protein